MISKLLLLLILSVLLVGLVFILFAVRILLKKNGQFPHTHIGGNKEMAKRGIYCASSTIKMEEKDRRHLLKE
ncbi:hypothetical protein ACT29H_07630 [Thermophagus sp. OGC60D27]|uniref:hypothetical protein n=1 Tax=Thermophagus sp. OGC60D27 TaxID=3458415 RepID=UPI004037A63C